MTLIKICGITNIEDAQAAVSLGVDALGFNFCSNSPRYILPENAREIIRKLPQTIWTVGVFVNSSIEEVCKVSQTSEINTLQFHGLETVAYCKEFRSFRTIKALRLADDYDKNLLDAYVHVVDYLLIDYFDKHQVGGTGKEVNTPTLLRLHRDGILQRSFLAGGLNEKNVQSKIQTYNPLGVDVASGVESYAIKKDHKLMEQFVRQVRAELDLDSSPVERGR